MGVVRDFFNRLINRNDTTAESNQPNKGITDGRRSVEVSDIEKRTMFIFDVETVQVDGVDAALVDFVATDKKGNWYAAETAEIGGETLFLMKRAGDTKLPCASNIEVVNAKGKPLYCSSFEEAAKDLQEQDDQPRRKTPMPEQIENAQKAADEHNANRNTPVERPRPGMEL